MRRAAISLFVLLASGFLEFFSHARAQESIAPLRDRVLLGAYVAGLPYFEQSERAFEALERKLGTTLPILSGFVDWDYVFGEPRDLTLAAGGNRTLLYSWEPHCDPKNEASCVTVADVAAGKYDGYFSRIAESMRAFPHTIYVRPWAEMNAEWSPWQPGSGRPRAGTPAEFVRAWRHMRDFFRQRGIDNLKFVFNPDASDWETSSRIPEIWPGADYVDVLGIDGYNWGKGKPGGPGEWREFEEIFARMYQILTELHPTAPVWICEFGSKEPSKSDGGERPAPRDPLHKKGQWLERMLSSTAFPRLGALVHFNVHKERDFRFESSADALRAMRRQLRLRRASPHSTRTSIPGAIPATSASKQRSTAS